MVSLLDRKLARDLWNLKAQVLTIALVVASGVAAFVASLATYDSLRAMQSGYYDKARFAHLFAQVKRAPLNIADKILALPGVAQAEATLTYDVLLDIPGVVEPMIGRMIALPERGDALMNRLTLMKGRWIDAPESNQVLINESFATKRGLAVGQSVRALLNGKRESLTITGIVLSPEYIMAVRPGLGDEKTFGIFWIGRKRLAAAYNMEGAFNTLTLRLAYAASERAVIDPLDSMLAPYGSTGAYGRAEQMSHRALTQEINEQKIFGTVLPSIFLAVAMFLLNVVLSRQIGTQRGQIAALKALGRPDWEIGAHYLKFVLVIVGIGAVLGIVSGAWLGHMLTALYTRFFNFPRFEYRMQAWIPALGIGASLLAASAGALQAIVRVVRLPPAEAMRPPSPPSFRPTLMERIGLGRLYSPQVRMILRDLERRPLRAVVTTLGIAAALAILISGAWWRDAVEYLLEIDFRMRERQHIGLQFIEAASSTALYDLLRLPGVIKAEPDRQTAVRIHHGHRSYRTALVGLPAGGEQRLLLDEAVQRVALPPSGLIINQRLAKRLDLARGDHVSVEFLQGSRSTRDVVVTDFVDEKMAMQAYMERRALNALLLEGDVISGARLLIDPAQRESFFAFAKQTPKLAGLVEIEPVLRNFRETSGRNILVFTTVLTVLAGSIAVGVVYNHARIALSERAWELASLRVLGATRAEVSTLLLGEFAFELLCAFPLGWILGYGLSAFIVALIVHEDFEIPLIIHARTYAYASLVVLLASVLSALMVRRRVDGLDLVGVLKSRE